jgi:hypothetical protein
MEKKNLAGNALRGADADAGDRQWGRPCLGDRHQADLAGDIKWVAIAVLHTLGRF